MKATRSLANREQDAIWVIPLASVKSCAESEYDDGKGLQEIWSSKNSANIETERFCTLRCRGNVQSLRLEIGLFKGKKSKFSRLLFDEVIEEGKNVSIGILAFEMTRRLVITCNKTGRVPSKTVWNLAFLLDTDRKISLCKTSLRKLTDVAAKMPLSCISYRNFSNAAVDDDGSLTLERANHLSATFTGFLATAAGRRLIGESREDDEPAIITRSGGASQKRTANIGEAILMPGEQPTFAQRKGEKKLRKQTRKLAKKQGNKQAEPEAPPSQPTSVDSLEAEKVQGRPEAESSKSAAVAGSSSEQDTGPPAGDDDALDSGREWEIECLEGDRTHNGQTEYLVRWSGPRKPSWKPASNVPLSAIREYYAPQKPAMKPKTSATRHKLSTTRPKTSATASTTLKRRRSARIEAKELRDRGDRAA